MAFSLFRRKKKPQPPADPIAAYDGYIEDLERQGSEVRRSAATLLALRSELSRSAERYRTQLGQLEQRLGVAGERRDARAAEVLERDRLQARKQLASTEEALTRAETDGQLLVEAAKEITDQLTELKAERTHARARLAAGLVVTDAMRERAERIGKVLALEAARDEVERAHQLAEIYREERVKTKG
jgi:phage shock protein A